MKTKNLEGAMVVRAVPIESIRPYEYNPRLNDSSVDQVAASIKEFGWQQPIVVDADGVIVAGHTRYKAAQKLGLATVPVKVAANLTPEQIKAYRLVDNKTAELSTWDFDVLDAELAELADLGVDMSDYGFVDPEEADYAGALNDAEPLENVAYIGEDMTLISIAVPRKHKKAIKQYRSKNGDEELRRVILEKCGCVVDSTEAGSGSDA